MSESSVPRPAMAMGLAGLVPSLAAVAALLAWPEGRGAVAMAGVAYGAVVAGFAGGAWWGLAAAKAAPDALARHLVLAMVPGLVAWLSLLVPPASGFAVLALHFALLPPMDRRLAGQGIAPAWWPGLRRPLSFGMAALHAAAAVILMLG